LKLRKCFGRIEQRGEDVIIRESYLNRIRPFYESDLIKILIGIRRCGKSVLLKQIKSELVGLGIEKSHIIYINFEDLKYSLIANELDLHKYIEDRIIDDEKYFLMFDEIQNVSNFEKAINSFRATLKCSIFLTGSNGKLLSG
jgi:predicted AAA+ superfamily ATPase